MRPVLLASLAAAALGVAAFAGAAADSLKDGQVTVTPGMWSWKQETHVLGFPIKEDNLECLIPEKATITLSKLAYDLDEGCRVDNVMEAPEGYTFKLICTGDIPGKADASLVHSDRMMSIRAKGNAKVLGLPAGFSMQADATYVGDCPPEELARQKAKYAEELKKEGKS